MHSRLDNCPMHVRFCTETVASRILPDKSMAIISITNPGDLAPLQSGWGAVLRVSFADAEYDEDVIRASGKLWPVSSLGFVTKDHALTIRKFIRFLDPSIKSLVVHGGAGESRSVAVAMYAAYSFGVLVEGNLTKHNTTVLRLLINPRVFDEVLPRPKESGLSALRWLAGAPTG